jgi:hypothetical protein
MSSTSSWELRQCYQEAYCSPVVWDNCLFNYFAFLSIWCAICILLSPEMINYHVSYGIFISPLKYVSYLLTEVIVASEMLCWAGGLDLGHSRDFLDVRHHAAVCCLSAVIRSSAVGLGYWKLFDSLAIVLWFFTYKIEPSFASFLPL